MSESEKPPGLKITTRDIAIAAVCAAIFAVTVGFASIFTIVPGWISFFMPLIWYSSFPRWFGVASIIGSSIGAFLGTGIFKPIGLGSAFEFMTCFNCQLVNFFLTPPKANLLKTKRDWGYILLFWILVETWASAYMTFTGLIWMGLLPPGPVGLSIYLITVFSDFWLIIPVVILLKAITPYLQRTGLYIPLYRERPNPKKWVMAAVLAYVAVYMIAEAIFFIGPYWLPR